MNTFQQLKDKEVVNILRINSDREKSSSSILIGVFILLEFYSGLLISFDWHSETTQISFMTLEEVQEEFGTEYGETSLDELSDNDVLKKLFGQKIKSIKVGQFADDKALGDTFVIKSGQYTGVILQLDNNKATFHAEKTGGQILLDSEDSFPSEKGWRLT